MTISSVYCPSVYVFILLPFIATNSSCCIGVDFTASNLPFPSVLCHEYLYSFCFCESFKVYIWRRICSLLSTLDTKKHFKSKNNLWLFTLCIKMYPFASIQKKEDKMISKFISIIINYAYLLVLGIEHIVSWMLRIYHWATPPATFLKF